MILWSKNQQFRQVIEDLVKSYTKSDYPESSITSNLFWTEAKSSNLVLISVSAETNKKIVPVLVFLLKQKQESFFCFSIGFGLKEKWLFWSILVSAYRSYTSSNPWSVVQPLTRLQSQTYPSACLLCHVRSK